MKNNYLSSSFNSVVSLDMDTSWAAKSWDLSSIYWNQNGKQVNSKKPVSTDFYISDQVAVFPPNRGKVRQLFLERRGKGLDRSYPLEPIKPKTKPCRFQKQSPRTKSVSDLPDYYNNPGEKTELFNIPARLPNLGTTNTMQSNTNDYLSSKKGDSKSKIPQPRGASKNSVPPTEEMRKLTLSPRKVQDPERSLSSAKIKPATPSLGAGHVNRPRVMTPHEKNAPSQKGQLERVTATSKPGTPIRTATPQKTPIKNMDPNMEQCSICGRSFLKERIKVHETICKKAVGKKRKIFDPVKHRLAGTEAEPYMRKGTSQTKSARSVAPPKPKSDWRKKHEDFIAAIRAAKQVQDHLAKGGNLRDLPAPPPMDTSDYVQCPHCTRKFTASVADRHIPICSKVKSNKVQTPKRGVTKKK